MIVDHFIATVYIKKNIYIYMIAWKRLISHLVLRSKIWDYIHIIICIYILKILKLLHMLIHSFLERKVTKHIPCVHVLGILSQLHFHKKADRETTANECLPITHCSLAVLIFVHFLTHTNLFPSHKLFHYVLNKCLLLCDKFCKAVEYDTI